MFNISLKWIELEGAGAHGREKELAAQASLMIAAQHGLLATLLGAIADGADVNRVSLLKNNAGQAEGWTPLSLACESGRWDIALALLERGADPGAGEAYAGDHTPLALCALAGELDWVDRLISLGASVSAKGRPRFSHSMGALSPLTHLVWAMRSENSAEPLYKNQESVALRLIELGANPSDEGGWGDPLLCRVSSLRVAKALINAGADLEARDRHGHTPLMNATLSGEVEICKALAQAGALLEPVDNNGDSAMDSAIKKLAICSGSDALAYIVAHLPRWSANALEASARSEGLAPSRPRRV